MTIATANRRPLRNNYEGVAIKYRPMVYTVAEYAMASAARCIKPHRVVMGIVGQYLVVCPADASRLCRAGFEMIA